MTVGWLSSVKDLRLTFDGGVLLLARGDCSVVWITRTTGCNSEGRRDARCPERSFRTLLRHLSHESVVLSLRRIQEKIELGVDKLEGEYFDGRMDGNIGAG